MTLPDVARELIRMALEEDIGPGDWTTRWTVPRERRAEAVIVAKAEGILSGLDVALAVFHSVDPDLQLVARLTDGSPLEPGTVVLELSGAARSILTAERVALNLLQRLSGVASLTRRFVDSVSGTGSRILDTRKTTPGLRALEKRAVRHGGGVNHRFGLHDLVLIKENHIAAAGGITAAVSRVRQENTLNLDIEVEVTTMAELNEALACRVDRVLFDNMTPDTLRAAVAVARTTDPPPETEASGGVTLETVRAIAETGVQFISVGALTHSPPALDLSLLIRQN